MYNKIFDPHSCYYNIICPKPPVVVKFLRNQSSFIKCKNRFLSPFVLFLCLLKSKFSTNLNETSFIFHNHTENMVADNEKEYYTRVYMYV